VVLPDLSRPSMTINAPRAMISINLGAGSGEGREELGRSESCNWIGQIVVGPDWLMSMHHAHPRARTKQVTRNEEKFAPPTDPLVYASSL